jgi:hypothetical protein
MGFPDTGGRRDSGPRDGGGVDARLPDGALPDGPTPDAPLTPDGAMPDAPITPDGGMDAGPMPDSGPIPDSGPEPDSGPRPDSGLCERLSGMGTFCTDSSMCAAGESCVPDGCGTSRCVLGGHRCVDASDCAAGSTCMAFGTRSACVDPGGGCNDSRDCPLGFACEGGACVNRRLPCSLFDDGSGSGGCPEGFICSGSGGEFGGAPFCYRSYDPCGNDGACVMGIGRCIDVAGGGQRVCFLPGACDANSDCADRQVCGLDPENMFAFCGAFGPCAADADCPVGSTCRDLWGDGVRDCVRTGGTCASSADCPAMQICGEPNGGGTPRCVDAT